MRGETFVQIFWLSAAICTAIGAVQLVREQARRLLPGQESRRLSIGFATKLLSVMLALYAALVFSIEVYLRLQQPKPNLTLSPAQRIVQAAPDEALANFGSILRLRTPLHVDCTQVRKQPDGQWDVFGTIRSNGLNFSQSIVGPHMYIIDGRDMYQEIESQCGK